MKEIFITITNGIVPSEGIMQMVDGEYGNSYIFKVEDEEVDMLLEELDSEGIKFTISISEVK
tara:strand:+ start:124 stop:309 length:186 start_codon:yes stop_codon:yes gene_type:complete